MAATRAAAAPATLDRFDPFDSGTWTPAEGAYFTTVDEAFVAKQDQVISNGKAQHAAYLIHKFLSEASQCVRLLSGNLPLVSGGTPMFSSVHIVSAAQCFLAKPGSSLKIVVEKPLEIDPSLHPLTWGIEYLKRCGALEGTLDIRQADDASLQLLRDDGFYHHWMTMDGWAYRLETDPNKAEAIVNFGNPDFASALEVFFDDGLFEVGERLVAVAA